jgi:hypothetical protein
VVRNAWRRAAAIAWAEPERSITLTLLADEGDPDPWQTCRRRTWLTRRGIQRLGYDPGEWVVHIEPNPRETGFHGHLWHHGPRIPKEVLQSAAHSAGAGWSRIEKIRTQKGVAAYGLKGLGYGLKGTEDSAPEYLRLNGGRLTHQSRGFFRGLSVREAERQAFSSKDGDRDEWQVHFA